MQFRQNVAVKDWIRGPLGSLGHRGLVVAGFASDSTVGIEAQRLWQEHYDERYCREVDLSWTQLEAGCQLTVQGRADGVWQTEDGWLLEEIKLAHSVPVASETLAWAQLQTYGYLFVVDRQLPEVELLLTWVDSSGQCLQQTRQTWGLAELEKVFLAHLEAWRPMLLVRTEAWIERRRSWANLVFPYEKPRLNQDDMIADVIHAHECGHFVFLRASTGAGKTAAALYGSLVCMTEEGRDQLIYTTIKNSGRQAVLTAFEAWRTKGVRAKVLLMEAAERMCPECALMGNHIQTLKFDPVQWRFLEDELRAKDVWDVTLIKQWAAHLHVCAHALGLGLQAWADVLIGDVNFIFDPFYRRLGRLQSKHSLLVVDEAHHLISRVRDAWATTVGYCQVFALQRYLTEEQDEDWLADLVAVFHELEQERQQMGESSLCFEKLPDRWLAALAGVRLVLEHFARQSQWLTSEFAECWKALERFFRISQMVGQGWVAYFQPLGDDAEIGLWCCHPQEVLSARWHLFASGVFMSASLEPFDAWLDLLGFRESDQKSNYSAGLRDDQLAVAIVAGMDMSLAKRSANLTSLIEWIEAIERLTPGHVVLFVPSLDFLDQIWSRLGCGDGPIRRFRQESQMNGHDRQVLMEEFAASEKATLLVLHGGSFAEGISLAQGKVDTVAIMSTGLAPPTLKTELTRWYFDQHEELGFEYAYFYPAVQKLWQAAGRLIRGPTNRGYLLLFDRRFGSHPWPDHFPAHWPEPMNLRNIKQLKTHMSEFFDGTGDNF